MPKKRTVLIVPPNDPEAVMITEIARKAGIQMIRSNQAHGASLDHEPDLVPLVRDGGWERVVTVEMPGPKTEDKLRKLGVEVVAIDHHQYDGLDRAHDPKTGKPLPSSLEQFLKTFRLTDAKLKGLGFDPRMVRAIGIMDRGYAWALLTEGYTRRDLRKVMDYQMELMSLVRDQSGEQRKRELARRVWERRKEWNGFAVVENESDTAVRARISDIIALEVGRPIPLILLDKKRGFVYVQESERAQELFRAFGGFTFGTAKNWGYRNEKGKKKVGLREIKKCLSAGLEAHV